ncbi:hypothetical protein KXD40_006349 [Peronospora effusa]|nr:hypothetical protein KXD40_006349 [Peronospora effusa]
MVEYEVREVVEQFQEEIFHVPGKPVEVLETQKSAAILELQGVDEKEVDHHVEKLVVDLEMVVDHCVEMLYY